MKSFVVYERYETAGDERLCARCAHLAGAIFEQGKGPHPLRHKGCRCRRVYSHTVNEVPAPPPAAEPAPDPWPALPLLIPPIIIGPEYPTPPDDKEDE